MLRKTVLNAAHRALERPDGRFRWLGHARQLRLADRGAPCRAQGTAACSMLSHMCPADVAGPDCRAFLSRLVANDVAKLQASGKALYSAMLNDAGGVIDDLIIYFLGETRFRIVINAGTAEKDLAWMRAKAVEWQLDVTITPAPRRRRRARHHRRAGSQRTCEGLAGAAAGQGRDRKPEAFFRRRSRPVLHRQHRLHRRRRL
jgi:glycine cleavage system aminomethyltransferase T